MRCPRCGNENSDQNRFCGMCGATLLAAPEPATAPPQRVATPVSTTAAAAPRPQPKEPTQPAAPRSSAAPSISGPSFLGLNDPAPRKRASLSIDPHSAPSSRNLDYLLEDDGEEHKSSGAGKVFLILIALVLAVGLGYLRWKNHGFGWLGTTNKPSASTQTATDTNSPLSSAPDSQPSAATQPTPATQPPPVSTPANATSALTPAPGTTKPAVPSAAASTDDAQPPDTTNSAPTSDTPAQPAAKSPSSAPKQPADSSATSPDTSDEAKPAVEQPKPRPTVKPAAPVDPVAEAQKYLYGRGVPQDCERGMRLLKPAANQSNPKAMIEMGALYSAGLCTPHDLPTAYRWFAMALRKDPNNDAVQSDLQKLWGEMTQPERQLAIKLTQ